MQAVEAYRENPFLLWNPCPERPLDDAGQNSNTATEPSVLGFIQEEGINVLGRTLTVIGGAGQVLLGGAVCAGVVTCAGGAGLMAYGFSNIQEGFTGEDGFLRNQFQTAFGETNGDLAFGAINLGTSIGGWTRPVLRPDSWSLFRNVPSDYVSAYNLSTRTGLAAEGAATVMDLYGTYDRVGQ